MLNPRRAGRGEKYYPPPPPRFSWITKKKQKISKWNFLHLILHQFDITSENLVEIWLLVFEKITIFWRHSTAFLGRNSSVFKTSQKLEFKAKDTKLTVYMYTTRWLSRISIFFLFGCLKNSENWRFWKKGYEIHSFGIKKKRRIYEIFVKFW